MCLYYTIFKMDVKADPSGKVNTDWHLCHLFIIFGRKRQNKVIELNYFYAMMILTYSLALVGRNG